MRMRPCVSAYARKFGRQKNQIAREGCMYTCTQVTMYVVTYACCLKNLCLAYRDCYIIIITIIIIIVIIIIIIILTIIIIIIIIILILIIVTICIIIMLIIIIILLLLLLSSSL